MFVQVVRLVPVADVRRHGWVMWVIGLVTGLHIGVGIALLFLL